MLTLNTKMLLVTFATLAALHIIALKLSLYWRIIWLDIPMHLFGGIIIALGIYTLRDVSVPLPVKIFKPIYFICAVMVVALVWEIFEFSLTTNLPTNYVLDTVSDLLNGFIGGCLGFFIGKKFQTLDI